MSDTCKCGWQLPVSCVPFKMGDEPHYGGEVKGVYVALRCPRCDTGHAFINALDPNGPEELIRQNTAVISKRRNSGN